LSLFVVAASLNFKKTIRLDQFAKIQTISHMMKNHGHCLQTTGMTFAISMALLLPINGCAATGTKAPTSSLNALKQAAQEEAETTRRFSKSAISASEMLKNQPVQDFRDTIVP